MQHFHHIRLQEVIKSLGNLAASLLKTSETILIGSRKGNKNFFLSPQTDGLHTRSMKIFPIWEQPSPFLHFQVNPSDGIRHHYLIIHLHHSYLTFQHQESVSSQLCLGIEGKKDK